MRRRAGRTGQRDLGVGNGAALRIRYASGHGSLLLREHVRQVEQQYSQKGKEYLACVAVPLAQPASWQPPPATPGALKIHNATFNTDSIEFTLQPGEGMEYKYRLLRDAAFVFTWSSSAPVHYELHSVPDGAPSDFAETFDKQDERPMGSGSYAAPFTGIHGWYWQNRTSTPVTLKLAAYGFFTESQEFRKGTAPKRKVF